MDYHSKKVKKKRCKECNKLFVPFKTTQVVCDYKCAIAYAKTLKKQKKEDSKMIDKLIKEKKDRNKLSTYLENTKTIVHKYIRLRDEGKPCISCGTPYKKDFDAGHFYPAGKFTSLKFNFDNIHGQCIQCNRRNEGEFEMYSLSLPNRIGIESYQKLVKRAETSIKTIKKWSREELKQIQNEAKEKIKNI